LAREDRERQLARDRHALAHHKAIVASLVSTRRTIERARSDKAVRAATARLAEIEIEIEKRLESINLWGNVSPLTTTYREMLLSLRQALARDRRAPPDGGPDGQADSRLDWNRRMGGIRAYLREAAESVGE
jgi:hypothetical protein